MLSIPPPSSRESSNWKTGCEYCFYFQPRHPSKNKAHQYVAGFGHDYYYNELTIHRNFVFSIFSVVRYHFVYLSGYSGMDAVDGWLPQEHLLFLCALWMKRAQPRLSLKTSTCYTLRFKPKWHPLSASSSKFFLRSVPSHATGPDRRESRHTVQ